MNKVSNNSPDDADNILVEASAILLDVRNLQYAQIRRQVSATVQLILPDLKFLRNCF